MLLLISGGDPTQSRVRRFISRQIHPHLEVLNDQARRAEAASQKLLEFFQGTDPSFSGLAELEAEAHAVNNALTERLRASFLSPLDPEDVQAVSTALTHVIQSLRRAADAAGELPSCRRPAPVLLQLTVMVADIGAVVRGLKAGQSGFERAADVMRGQRAVRASMRDAVAALVREEGDLHHLLAEYRLHAALGEVLQRLRKTAACLQGLILKNG